MSSEVGLSAVNFKGKYPKKGQLTSVKATFWCTGVARQAEWKDYINPACNKNAGEGMLKWNWKIKAGLTDDVHKFLQDIKEQKIICTLP